MFLNTQIIGGGSCNKTDMIYITQIAFKICRLRPLGYCLRAGGLNSVTLRPAMIDVFVGKNCRSWLIVLPRSRSSLRDGLSDGPCDGG